MSWVAASSFSTACFICLNSIGISFFSTGCCHSGSSSMTFGVLVEYFTGVTRIPGTRKVFFRVNIWIDHQSRWERAIIRRGVCSWLQLEQCCNAFTKSGTCDFALKVLQKIAILQRLNKCGHFSRCRAALKKSWQAKSLTSRPQLGMSLLEHEQILIFSLMAGTYAGMVSVLISHPVDTVKVRQQSLTSNNLSALQNVKSAITTEGVSTRRNFRAHI